MQKEGKDVDKIVIIIHGFMASLKASWVHEMKNTIQDMEENTAVMVRLFNHWSSKPFGASSQGYLVIC